MWQGSGAMCSARSTSSARSSTCSCPPDETLTPLSGSSSRPWALQAFGQSRSPPTGAPVYPAALEALLPAAWHRTDQYANNRVECDHSRLKARLRPMRGLKQDRSVRVVIAGHAFMQNFRRGHYELAIEEPATLRLAVAFDELALAIRHLNQCRSFSLPRTGQTQHCPQDRPPAAGVVTVLVARVSRVAGRPARTGWPGRGRRPTGRRGR